MRRGQPVSSDIRQLIAHTLQTKSAQETADIAQVLLSTVYRVAAEFRQTGSIQGPKTRRKGYFRALDDACIQVCDFCAIDASIYCTQCYFQYLVGRIQQTPDVYLEELSEELR
jgi:transposase